MSTQSVEEIFTLNNSNMQNFKTHFLLIVTTSKDRISHVEHVSGPLYAFFTTLALGADWGRSQGTSGQTANAIFTLSSSKNGNFQERLFIFCFRGFFRIFHCLSLGARGSKGLSTDCLCPQQHKN